MKKIFIISFIAFFYLPVLAQLKVVTAYPYISDIAKKIGGNSIQVDALASGTWDPHYIVPKPSLIAKVRQADLLIINGAELEIGWMPPLIRDSKNAKVQPGASGFLDLSAHVDLIDKPENVSRAHGDVHPSGNPHYSLNPDNILILAKAICDKLCALDNQNSSLYRANLEQFASAWDAKLKEWGDKLKSMQGIKVIQYHKLFDYFLNRFGIDLVMEIEPLPGIPPTSAHIKKIIDVVKTGSVSLIITDVYHSQKPVKMISEKTKARYAVLPHDVNSVAGVTDIFSLFDEIVRRITND